MVFICSLQHSPWQTRARRSNLSIGHAKLSLLVERLLANSWHVVVFNHRRPDRLVAKSLAGWVELSHSSLIDVN